MIASGIVLLSQNFWLVTLSQVATAIAGAAIGPAVSGITLGIVRQAGFNRQNGHNQAFNHAGNMVGAGLSGLLGWMFGFPAVLVLAAMFGVLSIVSVLMIPSAAIDDREARGLNKDGDHNGKAGGFACCSNASRCSSWPRRSPLPSRQRRHASALRHRRRRGQAGRPASFVAITIVVAQGVMIVASSSPCASPRSRLLAGAADLVYRAADPRRARCLRNERMGRLSRADLDGIGAGLQSVAVPGLVARILCGTGRVNVGQGAVMTVQGLGASLSPALGGWIAQ